MYRVWWGNLRDRDHSGEACTGFGGETWETETTVERRVQGLVGKPGRQRPLWRGVYRVWWGNPGDRDHWGDPGVDGRIILRSIFRKWDVGYELDRAGS
jgi:hypothetical protein